jgi:hypothetical protein
MRSIDNTFTGTRGENPRSCLSSPHFNALRIHQVPWHSRWYQEILTLAQATTRQAREDSRREASGGEPYGPIRHPRREVAAIYLSSDIPLSRIVILRLSEGSVPSATPRIETLRLFRHPRR